MVKRRQKRNGNTLASPNTTNIAVRNLTPNTSQSSTICKTKINGVLDTIWDSVRRWKFAATKVDREGASMKTWSPMSKPTSGIPYWIQWDSDVVCREEGGAPTLFGFIFPQSLSHSIVLSLLHWSLSSPPLPLPLSLIPLSSHSCLWRWDINLSRKLRQNISFCKPAEYSP